MGLVIDEIIVKGAEIFVELLEAVVGDFGGGGEGAEVEGGGDYGFES